jgi:hypothetical protein
VRLDPVPGEALLSGVMLAIEEHVAQTVAHFARRLEIARVIAVREQLACALLCRIQTARLTPERTRSRTRGRLWIVPDLWTAAPSSARSHNGNACRGPQVLGLPRHHVRRRSSFAAIHTLHRLTTKVDFREGRRETALTSIEFGTVRLERIR